MVTFTELLEIDVNGLETFASRWYRIRRKIEETKRDFHGDVVRKLHNDAWRGAGGRSAEAYCDRIERGMDALSTQAKSLATSVDEAADGGRGRGGGKQLTALQRRAMDLQEEAAGKGMSITGKGKVQWAVAHDPESGEGDETVAESRTEAAALQKRVDKVLKEANELDRLLRESLKVAFGTPHNFETEGRGYRSLKPNGKDEEVRNQFNNVAAYLSLVKGWPTASGLVQHYLGGSGDPVEVDPRQMMDSIPKFDRAVATELDNVRTQPDGTFTTEWKRTNPNPADGDSSLEWYYALNNFNYRLTGEKADGEIAYRVEIHKNYDYGPPSEQRHSITGSVGPIDAITLEQADLARLHSTGLARNFEVNGRSETMRAPD